LWTNQPKNAKIQGIKDLLYNTNAFFHNRLGLCRRCRPHTLTGVKLGNCSKRLIP
jgi:hypothetical protein